MIHLLALLNKSQLNDIFMHFKELSNVHNIGCNPDATQSNLSCLKAGFHMSHFIPFHPMSSQLVGCPQLRVSNYMKFEDRNSSSFIVENKMF